MATEQRTIEERVLRTAAGGWRYSDKVYHERWMARIMRKVKVDEAGCWIWLGACHPKGYAQSGYRGHTMNLHRAMYMATTGAKLATEQLVCHTCDVRNCINPAHLFLGTAADNNRDCGNKGRHHNGKKTHCKRGHEFTYENTYLKVAATTVMRACKECMRLKNRKQAAA